MFASNEHKNDLSVKTDSTISESYFLTNSNIEPDYEYKGYNKFGHVLGRGRFGTVIECNRKSDNRSIALKFFKHNAIHNWIPESVVISDMDEKLLAESEFFSKLNPEEEDRMLPSEVACLIRANKVKGVVKILDYLPYNRKIHLTCKDSGSESDNEKLIDKIEDDDDDYDDEESIIGIVLERNATEICLFDYLLKKQLLLETEAKLILKQIIQINIDLLLNGVIHGDLKSENILIDIRTNTVKIIDFGSAQIIDSSLSNKRTKKCSCLSKVNKPVKTFRGTNLYKPPEYILHHSFYPRPSTVWTFGIISYDMVCGHFPFDSDADVLMHQDKELIFTRTDLTENFKDLVKRCLAFYVADRISIDKILTHPWIGSV